MEELELAHRHVLEARRIVAEQRRRVRELREQGSDTTEAEQSLALFEQSLANFEGHLRDIANTPIVARTCIAARMAPKSKQPSDLSITLGNMRELGGA